MNDVKIIDLWRPMLAMARHDRRNTDYDHGSAKIVSAEYPTIG